MLRLARLATDISARGQGVGTELLRFVLKLAVRMAGDYGCVGVIVDAKPGAIEFYARFGFIATKVLEGQAEARPEPTPMFLATHMLLAATK